MDTTNEASVFLCSGEAVGIPVGEPPNPVFDLPRRLWGVF